MPVIEVINSYLINPWTYLIHVMAKCDLNKMISFYYHKNKLKILYWLFTNFIKFLFSLINRNGLTKNNIFSINYMYSTYYYLFSIFEYHKITNFMTMLELKNAFLNILITRKQIIIIIIIRITRSMHKKQQQKIFIHPAQLYWKLINLLIFS